ncbi:MAG: aminotransferase class I/II-fold pyridoxal phosphate-dependent enzyme [Hyphomicrobiales bacterium]|jgi:N-succinyldiaminopimelate aminotransferase|nr:aminotransferase class I/II-fold pyridoxal phosphate-dependent enzyme [Hyphomicrobiales bacterium]|tara:strand:- start:444 stop:1601 length:1158 start_codon:yes stop_codon:yes gene_type:complete
MIPISPFQRTRDLLRDHPEPANLIDLSIGSPRHDTPSFIKKIIDDNFDKYANYPSSKANIHFGENISFWLKKRYKINKVEPIDNILPVSGSREGLFYASLLATKIKKDKTIFILPDPFYPVYAAAADYTEKEIYSMSVSKEDNYFPNLDKIPKVILEKTIAFYLCSPSNPQGSIADENYLLKLYSLSLEYNFLIISDECYSEIYRNEAPKSILKISEKYDFKNVLSLNSLSKRSNAPGLRSGFVAGDKKLINELFNLRNVAAPTVPIPIQIASEYLWSDEKHVIENRKLYNDKFDIFSKNINRDLNFEIPKGGFFAWLDISKYGNDEDITVKLWNSGIKVIPGSYLSINNKDVPDSKKYIRIALVGSTREISDAVDILNNIVKSI